MVSFNLLLESKNEIFFSFLLNNNYYVGIGLIMEGILSAAYHTCPSYSNFQFGNFNVKIL